VVWCRIVGVAHFDSADALIDAAFGRGNYLLVAIADLMQGHRQIASTPVNTTLAPSVVLCGVAGTLTAHLAPTMRTRRRRRSSVHPRVEF
jgi:hypothetical protein